MTHIFFDKITRLRAPPGGRNAAGEYVVGAIIETNFRASVQPMSLTDTDKENGVSLVERFKVYVLQAGALAAAVDDSVADRVKWNGKTFTVVESRSWGKSHCRATLLRQT